MYIQSQTKLSSTVDIMYARIGVQPFKLHEQNPGLKSLSILLKIFPHIVHIILAQY